MDARYAARGMEYVEVGWKGDLTLCRCKDGMSHLETRQTRYCAQQANHTNYG